MTPRKTAGGTYDPADRFVYFAAGSSAAYPHHVLAAVNDCMTASGEAKLVELLDAGHRVLLDSGIFWLTNEHKRATGCTMPEALQLPPEAIQGFDALFERYVYLATTYADRLWGYIELDQGGRDNKIKIRARLHALGLSPIPVYHPLNDGWDYFDDLAKGYDRIAVGNLVQASMAARVRLMHTLWERHRRYPKLWLHVLGLTANELCLPFPPDSCDSSAWLSSLRWSSSSTEVAMMRRLPTLDHRFKYQQGHARDGDRGRDLSCQVCADSITQVNAVWRTVIDATPGEPYPRRIRSEGPLEPALPIERP